MMHIVVATLATEAESDDAIDEHEADGRRDHADRSPATDTPLSAP